MSNSTTTNSRLGLWEDDSNRPHKKQRNSPTDDADSSSNPFHKKKPMINYNTPESDWWVAISYLGSGSYGSVHYATSHIDYTRFPEELAIKSNEISQAWPLIKEEHFLTRLKGSPFVVSCYGYEIDDGYYNLMLEYCSGQCLAKYIVTNSSFKGGLAEDEVKRFASDILSGLKYIHGNKIIHCDIKPKNILLAAPDEKNNNRFRAKISDEKNNNRFRAKISGFRKSIEKGSISSSRGTRRFMPPEIIIGGGKALDYGADVWAFGCTVLEMLTGHRAWGEDDDELELEDFFTLIRETDLVPHVPDSLSQEAKDFLSKCLQRDPAQRWSVDSLLKHPFLGLKYTQEEEEEEIGDEAYLEEEEAQVYDAIGDAQVEIDEEERRRRRDEAYELEEEVDEEEEEEAIEIDEEYPREEDSEEDS